MTGYSPDHSRAWTRGISMIQGGFYFVTGLWPIVHVPSFEWITGPKRDLWLAQTVGLLLAVSGSVLILAARTRRITREIALLATGEAAVLGIIDVVTLWQPRTTLAYLGDALLEVVFVAIWLRAFLPHPRSHARRVMYEQYLGSDYHP